MEYISMAEDLCLAFFYVGGVREEMYLDRVVF